MKYEYLSRSRDFKELQKVIPDDALKEFECELKEYEEREQAEDECERFHSAIINWWEGLIETEDLIEFCKEVEII